jgi:ribosomal protein L37AE/L43A
MTVSTFIPTSVQCPQCGSHSIVEYKPTVYHCLKCDFEKNLGVSPEPKPTSSGPAVLGLLVGLGVVLALVL